MMTHQSSNLAALRVQQNEIGIALLDLSAGLFKVQQQEFQLEQLGIELSRLMPSEILVDENIVDPNIIEHIKTAHCPVTCCPNVDFNLEVCTKNLM